MGSKLQYDNSHCVRQSNWFALNTQPYVSRNRILCELSDIRYFMPFIELKRIRFMETKQIS